MIEEKIKKIVKARIYKKSSITDSFLEFLKKFKIKLPSRDKAKKTLAKYSMEDIKDAYDSISEILDMFKMKKSKELISSGEIDISVKNIKRIMILICLISLGTGILPKTPGAAEDLMKDEKIFYKDFYYIGKIDVSEVKKLVSPKDSFLTALSKIKSGIENGQIEFKGKLPENGKIRLFEDREIEVETTRDILNYGGVFLKLSK